jgi:hypothetical protein
MTPLSSSSPSNSSLPEVVNLEVIIATLTALPRVPRVLVNLLLLRVIGLFESVVGPYSYQSALTNYLIHCCIELHAEQLVGGAARD